MLCRSTKNRPDAARLRNESGVYRKLCNFLSLDPNYGKKGLTHGGARDKRVWNEFAEDRKELEKVARAIRENTASSVTGNPSESEQEPAEPEEDDFPEAKCSIEHIVRESGTEPSSRLQNATL